jgi:hypothetical protein
MNLVCSTHEHCTKTVQSDLCRVLFFDICYMYVVLDSTNSEGGKIWHKDCQDRWKIDEYMHGVKYTVVISD